ncbi:CBS domain-containing protein [Lutimaribacter pacificus]|uniref:CBS domain-containing protein n=1 Tax=Lutimaribacter pacificus TaxID=391948 RepID=A0A1H0CFJ9_9RHOB|nr:CBS domain-containing protein [Lutimaribacter pacificus]SDN56668.1 CBS domain-containing protein [Lutimaribacter pacificus]SHJ45017.1 CBS domain-containing protein [Lutimaribacter pacificus]
MLVRSIMRCPVIAVGPATSVRAVAALMKEWDIGAVVICEAGQVTGIVTDRDIVTRCFPNVPSDEPIAAIMTRDVATCRPGQTVREAANRMGDLQIRRLVVVDGTGAVGMITLGDIANDADEELAGQTLGEVVETR